MSIRSEVQRLLDAGLVKPMEEAPRDSTMLRLLVQYDHNDMQAKPLEDSDLAWTIGFNQFDHTGDDEWFLAGWDWTNDYFTESSGEPLAWLPFEPIFPEMPSAD